MIAILRLFESLFFEPLYMSSRGIALPFIKFINQILSLKNQIMNKLISILIFTGMCLFLSSQTTAQCSYLKSTKPLKYLKVNNKIKNHVFSGDSFGQIIKGTCLSSTPNFSFMSSGNSPTEVELEIFEGSSPNVLGTTSVYTSSKAEKLRAGNRGSELEYPISFNSFQSGKYYTFIFTIKAGNMIVLLSENDYADGQAYLNKGGAAGLEATCDMLFKTNSAAPSAPVSGKKLKVYDNTFSGTQGLYAVENLSINNPGPNDRWEKISAGSGKVKIKFVGSGGKYLKIDRNAVHSNDDFKVTLTANSSDATILTEEQVPNPTFSQYRVYYFIDDPVDCPNHSYYNNLTCKHKYFLYTWRDKLSFRKTRISPRDNEEDDLGVGSFWIFE